MVLGSKVEILIEVVCQAILPWSGDMPLGGDEKRYFSIPAEQKRSAACNGFG
jgi:hypothetical protein